MVISPLKKGFTPFTPFHPFVNRVGVKECACIKSSMLGNKKYIGAGISFDEYSTAQGEKGRRSKGTVIVIPALNVTAQSRSFAAPPAWKRTSS